MAVVREREITIPTDTSEYRRISPFPCDLGDIFSPLFRSVEKEVEKQFVAASPEDRRALQDFAKRLSLALVVVPHDSPEGGMYFGSFGRTEVVDAIRALSPFLDRKKIAPEVFDQVVLKVHKAVNSSPFGQEDRV